MSYKKYIKINGKLYGPYTYKSKRIGDKVLTEYVGKGSPISKSKNKLLWLLVPVALIIAALFIFNPSYTGRVTLTSTPNMTGGAAWIGISVWAPPSSLSDVSTAYSQGQLDDISNENVSIVNQSATTAGGTDCSALIPVTNCNNNLTEDCTLYYSTAGLTNCLIGGPQCQPNAPCAIYPYHKIKFNISDNISLVTQLSIRVHANASTAGTPSLALYAWNHTSSSYVLFDTANSCINLCNLTANITTTSKADFVNSSGDLYILVGKATGASGGNVEVRYAEVNVTSNLDIYPPLVTIISPSNTTYNTTIINFNFSLNETGYCEYSLNSGFTNYTMTANSSNTGFNATNSSIADGSYLVNSYCNDSSGNKNYTETKAFTVDTTPSNITLVSPGDATSTSSTPVSFQFNANDSSNIDNCSLIIDGTSVSTSTSISKTSTNTISYSPSVAAHTWSINCTDASTNTENSSSRTITITSSGDGGGDGGGGCTNDCTVLGTKKCSGDDVKVCNMSGACKKWVTEKNCKNLGNYSCQNGACVTGAAACSEWLCGNWSECKVGMQERNCTCKADLSLTKTENFDCAIKPFTLIYSPGTFNLKVPKDNEVNFSVSAFEEANLAEDLLIAVIWYGDGTRIKEDTGLMSVNSSIKGRYNNVKVEVLDFYNFKNLSWNIEYIDSNCTENWQCEWSLCDNRYTQPSECKDLNDCRTNADYPSSKVCSCSPQWQCEDWSDCQAEYTLNDLIAGKIKTRGIQERECVDNLSCYNTTGFEQYCDLNIPIVAKEVEWCNENYVEIYEKADYRLVSRVKMVEISNITRVNIGFIISKFGDYCGYCYDGKQDYNEERIDCGGPNCPACTEAPVVKEFDFGLIRIGLWLLAIILVIILLIYLYYKHRKEKKKKPNKEVKVKNKK